MHSRAPPELESGGRNGHTLWVVWRRRVRRGGRSWAPDRLGSLCKEILISPDGGGGGRRWFGGGVGKRSHLHGRGVPRSPLDFKRAHTHGSLRGVQQEERWQEGRRQEGWGRCWAGGGRVCACVHACARLWHACSAGTLHARQAAGS